jgi:hypothetical protein
MQDLVASDVELRLAAVRMLAYLPSASVKVFIRIVSLGGARI